MVDRQTILRASRALFYALTMINMHVELGRAGRGWEWRTELGASAEGWCVTPQPLMDLSGLKTVADRVLRALVPPSECSAWMALLGPLNSLLLCAAALRVAWPSSRLARLARPAPALCAACMLLLNAIFQSVRDTNHRWVLVSLCCVVLALDDPSEPAEAAHAACAAAAGCLFGAAGWSKLTGLGAGAPSLRWASGDALRFALSGNRANTWAAELLQRPALLRLSAAASLLLELGSPVVLLLLPAPRRGARAERAAAAGVCALSLSWVAFHLGAPSAWPQVTRGGAAPAPPAPASPPHPPTHPSEPRTLPSEPRWLGSAAPGLRALGLRALGLRAGQLEAGGHPMRAGGTGGREAAPCKA